MNWKQLVEHPPSEEPLSRAIIESWERCRAFDLDPDEDGMRRVSYGELQARFRANDALLAVARAHMQWASEVMAPVRPHVVILTDRDGIILHSVSNAPEVIAQFRLAPGFDWSEQVMGTNGLGTALAADRPVAVIGPEHYSRAWQNNTCVGAPVHAPDGTLVGAVDLCCRAVDGDPSRLIFAAFLAHVIERELVVRVGDGAARPFATPDLFAQSLRAPPPDARPSEQRAAGLERRARQLVALTDQMLEAGRLSGGQLALVYEQVDLAALVRAAVEQARRERPRAASALALRVTEPLAGRWDPVRLGHVVGQVLALALGQGAPRPVEVVAEPDGEDAVVTVRGGELESSSRVHGRVFEPLLFDDGSGPDRTGLVLGLWIVRQVVEAMAGTVRLADEADAAPALTIRLPRARP